MKVDLLIAAVGWVFAIVAGTIALLERIWRHAEHRDEMRLQMLVGVLPMFEGGSQKRNVGISMVQGLWNDAPDLHKALVPLLRNQALYLLSVSEQEERAHEVDNLTRIIGVLVEAKNKSRFADRKTLLDALDTKINTPSAAGLNIPAATLVAWRGALA